MHVIAVSFKFVALCLYLHLCYCLFLFLFLVVNSHIQHDVFTTGTYYKQITKKSDTDAYTVLSLTCRRCYSSLALQSILLIPQSLEIACGEADHQGKSDWATLSKALRPLCLEYGILASCSSKNSLLSSLSHFLHFYVRFPMIYIWSPLAAFMLSFNAARSNVS